MHSATNFPSGAFLFLKNNEISAYQLRRKAILEAARVQVPINRSEVVFRNFAPTSPNPRGASPVRGAAAPMRRIPGLGALRMERRDTGGRVFPGERSRRADGLRQPNATNECSPERGAGRPDFASRAQRGLWVVVGAQPSLLPPRSLGRGRSLRDAKMLCSLDVGLPIDFDRLGADLQATSGEGKARELGFVLGPTTSEGSPALEAPSGP